MNRIKNIPYDERPYEKLILYGEEALSNSELLSIIIKSGTKNESALEISQNLISKNELKSNSLNFLQTISINELQSFKGIGISKAVALKSVGEIAKRISKPINYNYIKISSQCDVAKIFMDELKNEKNEILKVILLDSQNLIKKIKTIAIGNESNIFVNIKTILSEIIKMQLPKLILVHNHPSGNPTPSKMDIEFTKKVKNIAKLIDVELLDHIIIGDGTYKNI